jgi:hypothetical protein
MPIIVRALAQTAIAANTPNMKAGLSDSSSSAAATVHNANNPIKAPNNVRSAAVSKAQNVTHTELDALQLQNELATAIKTPTITKTDNAQVAAAL